MRQFSRKFVIGVAFLIHSTAFACSPSGFVIGWGQNGGGQATGVSSYHGPNGKPIRGVDLLATNVVILSDRPLSNISAVVAGHFSLALRCDGIVMGWGQI